MDQSLRGGLVEEYTVENYLATPALGLKAPLTSCGSLQDDCVLYQLSNRWLTTS